MRLSLSKTTSNGPDLAVASAPAPIASLPVLHRQALAALINDQHISDHDAERAGLLALSTPAPIGIVLDRLGLVPQTAWADALARLCGLDRLTAPLAGDVLDHHPRLSVSFMQSRHALAFKHETTPGGWAFAISDPADGTLLKALRLVCGEAPSLIIATQREIENGHAELSDRTNREQAPSATGFAHGDAEHLRELANNAPTISLVDSVFDAAITRRATDIHVEPGERHGRIRLRIDGVLVEHGLVAQDLYAGVVSRLKILSGIDIAERRLPQDGRISHRGHGQSFDVRVATMPTVTGESVSLRMLRHDGGPTSIDNLGLPEHARSLIESALSLRNGIILATGPTGSGKTTSLHALLAQLNDGSAKIMTVENPVEIKVPGIVQIEANPDIGLTFASGLRSILRHDPDIIMVGEIRDAETASIAIQAALTGHLVLSTIHTNDAGSTVTRLADMGIEPFLIRATLRLAIGQRLVRRLCDHCAAPAEADPRLSALLDRFSIWGTQNQPPRLREPKGCSACGLTGFKGRQAIFECAGPEALGAEIAGSGRGAMHIIPMLAHGLLLISAGETTLSEVLRVVDLSGAEHEFN
jgi:type II secretory ATPase GspE/PulE/Tfp pilus assembly ATPase PilB-like protein